MENKVLGALYGLAIGDALGMPSELWSRKRVKAHFGEITTFLDGPAENEAACFFTKGQFTDDTAQALTIVDALVQNDFIPSQEKIADALMQWAIDWDAFNKNILGPSSKAALNAIKAGEDPALYTKSALTNGAAMRIAPIGTLFTSDQKEALIEYVAQISAATHASDVSVAGASMIAYAVSLAMEDKDWETIMAETIAMYDQAMEAGAETFSASIAARLELAMEYGKKYGNDAEGYAQWLYDVIGCGTMTSEAVPTALAIAYYCQDPHECAHFCANIGGDTDTIGAMATAICGAKAGFEAFDSNWVEVIDQNNDLSVRKYAKILLEQRNKQ